MKTVSLASMLGLVLGALLMWVLNMPHERVDLCPHRQIIRTTVPAAISYAPPKALSPTTAIIDGRGVTYPTGQNKTDMPDVLIEVCVP